MRAANKTDPRRNGLLAKIHIAKKSLALEDDNYRELLKRVTGKTSSSKMSIKELEDVMTVFTQYGFQDKKSKPKRAGKKPMANSPQASKIRALWLNLYHIGEIVDPSEENLTAFAKRMCGVDALQWMTSYEADKVIKALRGWLQRLGMRFPSADDIQSVYIRRFEREADQEGKLDYSCDALTEKLFLILYQARILGVTREEIPRLVSDMGFERPSHLIYINYDDVDPLIEKLGASIRRNKK